MLSGSACNSRISSVVSTPGRSTPGIGSRADSEPVATIIFLVAISSSFTLTRRGDRMRPVPLQTLILFCFISCSTPDTSWLAILLLRAIIFWKLVLTTGISNPKSSALFASRSTSTLLTSALVGIQPRLRQVPPNLSRSTTATLAPRCAAWIAAT